MMIGLLFYRLSPVDHEDIYCGDETERSCPESNGEGVRRVVGLCFRVSRSIDFARCLRRLDIGGVWHGDGWRVLGIGVGRRCW